ncbi:lysine decarboxylase [Lacrimispora amygdalina]|uniref:Lysine decarboxylase n=1 Tax=Lacrimispora amygdalina TaxID=253257 RepID=A0ABQ5MAJ6_9FIRM|nr:decarboxylase [uncultured Clostridium sp.]
MSQKTDLIERLKKYGNSDFYPFHMPGHKRQWKESFSKKFTNPFTIDITEIDGFDNLHHPQGILRESMEWAAKVYNSDRTYYLVNGSSCGILSAISGTVSRGGTILMSRNCHKSAYHGVFLNDLKVEYIYPQLIGGFGLQGGILPEEMEKMLKNHPEVEAVLVVSPTYDGIVSDVRMLASIVHKFDLPLIVDEAHGAHFSFGKGEGFPVSALELGADVVIQSLHKTLPSLTQTAVMHVKSGYVNLDRLDRYVHMYQTSSPSYVLLASVDNCIGFMDDQGRGCMKEFFEKIMGLRERLKELSYLKILNEEVKGQSGVYDVDLSKLIISTRESSLTGAELNCLLREEYHLEMEMCGPDYVTAILTLADTKEGFERLSEALLDIDSRAGKETRVYSGSINKAEEYGDFKVRPECRVTIAQGMDSCRRRVPLKDAADRVSAEFVYIYPPGIPIIAPGEVLKKELVDLIIEYKDMELPVQGLEDENAEYIYIMDEAVK